MLKNFRLSLTLRIFLITGALLIAACAATYGMIAYLTPITYTSILEDELHRESETLVSELEKVAASDGSALLDGFVRQTGAELMVIDDRGAVLYETASTSVVTAAESSAETDVVEEISAGKYSVSINDSDPDLSSAKVEAEWGTATIADEDIVMEAYDSPNGYYHFTYSDGTSAMLTVSGGMRAVNQAVEALDRVLPFLAGVVLFISLAAAFFYARFITRPIVSISKIARRMAALDFEARWLGRRHDEIGALGDSLNHLSDNLFGTLHQLEEANFALQRDIDRERELDRQRMAFFSAASHELKTPITILKGQLSGMLAQVGIYRDREKYLARALEVTGRMEGLVREILMINRIGSGGFSLAARAVDLGELMTRQLALDHELLEQKGLSIETHIETGSVVQGDESLLAKVLDNVLINAILYSPFGANISVEVNGCAFSVENTGVSIPEESLKQLFTPFYRVEQSRNRKSGGSGLGLYLVGSILDLHEASYEMANTTHGVRFSARFP